jgi:molybdopterin molybdotransferase
MEMKDFLRVTDLDQVFAHKSEFPVVETEDIPLVEASGRIIAEAVNADVDLPDFPRATMDGYAVRGASTFGSSEANPAYLTLKGAVRMGDVPDFSIGPGEAARIYTGGMLPAGADAVVMVEHTELLDDTTIEVYRSVAPGQHLVGVGEDFPIGAVPVLPGRKIRPQEAGLLAAFGRDPVTVYRRPVVTIISTGDEVVPVDRIPGRGQIRDINTYTLAGLVQEAGSIPVCGGIVGDVAEDLQAACRSALDYSDMILISGGSSMGARDFTIEALSCLPDSEILVHGIPISPGKPTILSRSGRMPIWGLPGHVVSAMVVFAAVVRPFIDHVAGYAGHPRASWPLRAQLTRNVASAQGRIDYVRVTLSESGGTCWAEPILGKSALINTMVKADGMFAIDLNVEGLDAGEVVDVLLF